MSECKRCGECCKVIVFGAAYGGADWNEYYHARGCRIVPNVGLVVPSVCPHLRQIKAPGADKNGVKSDALYRCDIYDKRPELCRIKADDPKGLKFLKPPGCTK
jgi:hypothetical protein